MNFSLPVSQVREKQVIFIGVIQNGVMVNGNELPQTTSSPQRVKKYKASPKLKTALTRLGLLNTWPDITKEVLARAALLRVLLASFQDLKNSLPNCKMKAENGSIFFKITWSGYWLDFDKDNRVVVAELEEE